MKLIDREIQQLTAMADASQPLPAPSRIAPLALPIEWARNGERGFGQIVTTDG